jgi:hypothetical protein
MCVLDISKKGDQLKINTPRSIFFRHQTLERKRRGCSEKLIVTGENTKKPPDWKTFLANEETKKQLIELLCRVCSTDNFAPKLLGKNVITVSDGHAFHITSYDGTSVCRTEIESIESTQEETDSRVVLILLL